MVGNFFFFLIFMRVVDSARGGFFVEISIYTSLVVFSLSYLVAKT